MTARHPLLRGATVGIIGGGQLGRMLAIAGARLGMKTVILDPQPHCPAAQVSNRQIKAAYDDKDALAELADGCDAVTFEFENVDTTAIRALEGRTPIWPPVFSLEVSQDRLVEKEFLNAAGLKTAPYRDCPDVEALCEALDEFEGRGILKTRRFGYDGKGQVRFNGRDGKISVADALDALGNAPAILEGFVDFACEISVIATRSQNGETKAFEPALNVHVDGVLSTSAVPANVDPNIVDAAINGAHALANRLDYVGTLGLEYFIMPDGTLIANEFAPRVHNSGHWTEEACAVSQFEMHMRAIAGWPLPTPLRYSDAVMTNLIGDEISQAAHLATKPNIVIYDYGKTEARPGRKMGHFTVLKPKS